MQRYFLELAFLGTNFHGWQVQLNAYTVQEAINNALSKLLRKEIHVVGAGRTDTAVHAKQMYCHFDFHEDIKIKDLPYKLNCILGRDITCKRFFPVMEDCHARFSAISRTYEYHILLKDDPFKQDLAWKPYFIPDFELMNGLEEILLKYKDFSAFSKSRTQTKTNNCKIYFARWEKVEDNHWVFSIKADRFLRNMARAIVGTMLEIGWGRLEQKAFEEIILSKDRQKAGFSVPAKGLYLVKVKYPDKCLILQDGKK